MPKPEIVAHRGGAGLWPENSRTAFRQASGLDVEQVEMDVHLTADGELAVIHDPVLNRTTRGQGAVRDKTRAELSRTQLVGADEGVPFLDEVLALFDRSRLRLQIEIKIDAGGNRYPGIEERVLQLVQRFDLVDRVQLGAFQPGTLSTLQTLAPAPPLIGFIGSTSAQRAGGLAAAMELMVGAGARAVGLQHTIVTEEAIAIAGRLGIGLGLWTVNERADLDRWVRQPVSFITTDRPDLALAARAARG